MIFKIMTIVIITIIILIAFYVKYKSLTNRFWATQPCFHFFDIYYYFSNPAIIAKDLPQPNKYCDFVDVITYSFQELTETQQTEMVQFLQKNYDHLHVQSQDQILPFFKGFLDKNNQPMISFFYDTEHTQENMIPSSDTEKIKKERIIKATMTSRVMSFFAKGAYVGNVYYVDYLCVDKLNRKSGVAPKLIQTHEYNQRHRNKSIQISLFKREGELTFIVPLCAFKTHVYNITSRQLPKWENRKGNQKFVRVTSTNLHVWQHCLQEKLLNENSKFKVVMINDIGNILELLNTENIWIFMVITETPDNEDDVTAFYVFRLCGNHQSSSFSSSSSSSISSISCIGTVNFDDHDKDGFFWGFMNSLKWFQKETQWMLLLEEVSDSNELIYMLNKYVVDNDDNDDDDLIFEYMQGQSCAYFFYNYAMTPILPTDAFLMVT